MIILAEYKGMTKCQFNTWKEQKECEYSEKARHTDTCMWMRTDDLLYGTCSESNVCAEKSKIDLADEE